MQGTYEVAPEIAPIIEQKPLIAPRPVRSSDLEPPPQAPVQQQQMPYVPDNLDDIDSEIVRHAEPVDEMPLRQNVVPAATEGANTSMDINYNSDDLEIPAFLRKRGDA